MKRLIGLVPSVVLALVASSAALAATDFFDGDFGGDWTYFQIMAGTGGSATMQIQGPDGNPGAYIAASTHINGDCGAIYALAFKTTATYDPSTAGPLAALNYAEDAKLIDGFGSGQATGPAILQNGRVYVLPGFPTGTDENWHHMVAGGLTEGSFIEVLGGPCPDYTNPGSHPDFSENGSTMTFGYFRANSQIDGFGQYDIIAAIDNWNISLGPIFYAALGDSYSAGEGNAPFFADSNTPPNACHRSMGAYPFKVAFTGVHLNPEAFLACSGALTANIKPSAFGGYPPILSGNTEDPQMDKTYSAPPGTTLIVNDETDMVTLSVGGNDLGFVAILEKCRDAWIPDCSSDSFHPVETSPLSYKQIIAARIPTVGSRVSELYGLIKAQTNNAPTFVLGYPRLFDGDCGGLLGLAINENERKWLDSVSDALNAQIAASAAASGVHFVSVTGAFRGHGACSADRWIRRNEGPKYGWFHPTQMGQYAYARSLSLYMKRQVSQNQPLEPTGIPSNPGSFRSSGPPPSDAPLDLTPSLGDLYVEPFGLVPCNGAQVGYVPGQAIRVRGAGFGAGQTVAVRLQSTGYFTSFATASADASGNLDAVVTLPADAPTATDAELTAQGTGSEGETRQLSAGIAMSTSFGSDADFDEISDPCDNCPTVASFDTSDSDADGIGNVCDACPSDFENDIDGDGLCASVDACPYDAANDADGDAVCESVDNCPGVSNPSQLDTDGDTVGDACDGAPSNAGIWAAPGEVADLVFTDKTNLTWTPAWDDAGPQTVHDVARGAIVDLPFELFAPCIATGTIDPTATDTQVPAAGQGFWYLVHARNLLGNGTYGFASNGTERNVFGCP